MTKTEFLIKTKLEEHLYSSYKLNSLRELPKQENKRTAYSLPVDPQFGEYFDQIRDSLKAGKKYLELHTNEGELKVISFNEPIEISAEDSQFGIGTTLPAQVVLTTSLVIPELEIIEEVPDDAQEPATDEGMPF